MYRGSSPLTRGKRVLGEGDSLSDGLIPAHAGKTCSRRPLETIRGAHPRSRGENAGQIIEAFVGAGSSPLTRGKLALEALDNAGLGLIPAHAGKTCSWSCPRARSRAHPRSRGENPDAPGIASANWGSSPLTRGKHNCESSFHYLGRLIPAHAGKTGSAGLRWNTDRAHPRSRGKNARHAT